MNEGRRGFISAKHPNRQLETRKFGIPPAFPAGPTIFIAMYGTPGWAMTAKTKGLKILRDPLNVNRVNPDN
jgi:hypothetical protein